MPMFRTFQPLIVGLALTSLSACAGLMPGAAGSSPSAPAPQTSSDITPEQEARLRELGGPQLLADAKFAMDLGQSDETGEYQARSCLGKFFLAHKQESEANKHSAKANFRSCASLCEKAKQRSQDEALHAFADRFIERCQGRHNVLAGAKHLERARKKLEDFKVAKGSVNQYYRNSEVSGALRQAEEALGKDNPELIEVRQAYEAEYAPRKAAIARVNAFMRKPAVKSMRSDIDRLQQQVYALEKDAKYSEHSRVLLQQRRGDLRRAEARYSEAMTKAKL